MSPSWWKSRACCREGRQGHLQVPSRSQGGWEVECPRPGLQQDVVLGSRVWVSALEGVGLHTQPLSTLGTISGCRAGRT